MILLENVECICHEEKKNASLLVAFPGLSPASVVGSSAGTGAGRACVLSLCAAGHQARLHVGMVCLSFLWFYSAALHQEPFHVKPISKSEAPSEFHAVLQHDKEEIILFFF